jgi:hypothetical protein
VERQSERAPIRVLASRLGPEMVAKAKRRTFTPEYKGRWRPAPPRRTALVAAGLLAAAAGQRKPRSADSAKTPAEVQVQSKKI